MRTAQTPAHRFTVTAVLSLMLTGVVGCQSGKDAYAEARLRMVEGQIEARGISDTLVLNAMRKVERHRFVPENSREYAYSDYPLPIGEDQTISQPFIVALMTELLQLDSTKRVLEIGTGSGYQAAILSEIAAEVFTIEIVESLGLRAELLLDSLGYDNVTVQIGDGYRGWEEAAPFDAILLTAAPTEIPQPLLDQLGEGGRLVAPVGDKDQILTLVRRINGDLQYTNVSPVRFVPMTGEAQQSH